MNPAQLQQKKEKILKALDPLIEKAILVNEDFVSGVAFYKVIFFFLEKYISGSYYGTICAKITGTGVQNPYEVDVTHKLDRKYNVDD
jgi:hypothetical protein